jgi:hypothetical protein
MRARARRKANRPASNANVAAFKAPPPPPELVCGPTPFCGNTPSTTLTDPFADCPVALEMQVIPKVNVMPEVIWTDSVTVALPLVAFGPAQLSPSPPPVAVQLVALEDFHVSVSGWLKVMELSDAEIVAVGGPPLPAPDT